LLLSYRTSDIAATASVPLSRPNSASLRPSSASFSRLSSGSLRLQKTATRISSDSTHKSTSASAVSAIRRPKSSSQQKNPAASASRQYQTEQEQKEESDSSEREPPSKIKTKLFKKSISCHELVRYVDNPVVALSIGSSEAARNLLLRSAPLPPEESFSLSARGRGYKYCFKNKFHFLKFLSFFFMYVCID
jgi:hypothetical protein